MQSHVSRLRTSLGQGAPITSQFSGYRLDLEDDTLDSARFESLLDRAGLAASAADSATILAEALHLWRGPAFGELAELEWFQAAARRLEELRLEATEAWVDARLLDGDHAGVVGELESLVTSHPLRERFWRQLVVALHRAGRQAEALRRLSALRALLRDELGLDPSRATAELEARILADDPALFGTGDRQPAPNRRAAAESTSLVGRAHAIVEIGGALASHRLVTVTGPGGVGKTRVAQRATRDAAPRFRHGETTVELAPLRDPTGLGQVIATALDVQQRQHLSIDESVLEFLDDRELLLVLDNCEHLIDAVAGFAQRLLARCPSVTVLTTSREALGLPGEYVHVLSPLAVPASDAEALDEIARAPAVELFVDRATSAQPGFRLELGNAPAVSRICRRLDGLPLALELAAARLRALGPEALADRLDQRFGLLGTDRPHVELRQRTLRDLVLWSYELLDEAERDVFTQLSVFAGTFDLEDAAALCELDDACSVVAVLANLVEKSMVERSDADGPRYAVLETLREFGRGQLEDAGTLAEVERRHLEWYLELAKRGACGLDGPDEGLWSARLDLEIENFRVAHAHAIRAGDPDSAAMLVAELREHAFRHIRYEVCSWAEATIPHLRDEHPLYAVVLGVSAYGHWARGDLDRAVEQAELAVALGTGVGGCGLAERVLGNALFYLGRTDEALHWMDRMVDTARGSGSDAQLTHASYMRSVAQTSVGEGATGATIATETREASMRCGSPTSAAQAAYALGLALQGTDPDAALHLLGSAARRSSAAGNRWLAGFALTEVHWLTAREGAPLDGLRGYAAVIDTWYRGGDWANQWLSLRHVFGILMQLGEHRPAAVLQGALTAAGAAYALPYEPADAKRLTEDVLSLRHLLGPRGFAEATRQGTALSEGQVVTFVLGEIDRLVGAGGPSRTPPPLPTP